MDFNKIKHIDPKYSVDDAGCELLYTLAKESIGCIVEIGSWIGRTTACLALGAMEANPVPSVYAVDNWMYENSYERFTTNIKIAGVNDYIIPIRIKSEDAFISKVPSEAFLDGIGFLFIDGDHHYEYVKKDIAWIKYVKKGGKIAFHDYGDDIGKVGSAVREYLNDKGGLVKINQVESLIVFSKI